MDTFSDWVRQNMHVNPSDDEITEITGAVNIMVDRIIGAFNKISADTKIRKVVPCGSIVEGARIWRKSTLNVFYSHEPNDLRFINTEPELEFDYLAVVDSTHNSDLAYEEKCQEHVHFIDGKKCYRYSNMETFMEDFKITVLQAIVSCCSCYKLIYNKAEDEIYFGEADEFGGCERCEIKMETGVLKVKTPGTINFACLQSFHFSFEWISKEKSVRRPIFDCDLNVCVDKVSKVGVLFDLNPAVKLGNILTKSQKSPCRKSAELKQKGTLYALPKNCRTGHHDCWRISRCKAEMDILRNSDAIHINCLIVLKFLAIFFIITDRVTTYHLKTAVLHHINCCTEARTSQCLPGILSHLSESMRTVHLMKINTRCNLFPNDSYTEMATKIQGDMLAVLCQSGVWENEPEYILKFIVCLRFIYTSHFWYEMFPDSYYKCTDEEELLDRVNLILKKHGTKSDWDSIKLECSQTSKDLFKFSYRLNTSN